MIWYLLATCFVGALIGMCGALAVTRSTRRCWHHAPSTGESYLTGTLIDLGSRKMWRCRECRGTWFS